MSHLIYEDLPEETKGFLGYPENIHQSMADRIEDIVQRYERVSGEGCERKQLTNDLLAEIVREYETIVSENHPEFNEGQWELLVRAHVPGALNKLDNKCLDGLSGNLVSAAMSPFGTNKQWLREKVSRLSFVERCTLAEILYRVWSGPKETRSSTVLRRVQDAGGLIKINNLRRRSN